MRYAALLILVLAASSLVACGTSKYENDPDYDTGFSDGCSTGSARTPGARGDSSGSDRDIGGR